MICEICDCEFQESRASDKYCSDDCRREADNTENRKRRQIERNRRNLEKLNRILYGS